MGLYAMVIMVLGAAAGLAVTLPMTTLYTARTDIEYNVSVQDASDFLRTDRALTTQATLLTSRGVLGPVADANGVDPEELTRDVTATILSVNSVNSEVIQVDVLNADRATGMKLADAIGKRYLDVVASASPARYLQAQIDQTTQQLSSANAATAQALQTRLTTLQGQLDIQNLSGNKAAIVVAPYSVAAPAFPNPFLAAATGGLCGIVVAALVVIWLSRRWTRT
ncbi:MAG TPA: hypothetical protein VGM60_15520 [Pseudonocardia sp.]|uniref:hypothetical protein n=1 Tax=Pseudonocardia sp. TaxID=60912 RepID=UPI002F423B3F